MNKYIILTSRIDSNQNKAHVLNILPGPPLQLSPSSTRVALLDISFSLMEDLNDPARKQNTLIFPVDQSKNEIITFPRNGTIEEFNHEIQSIVARKFPGQVKSPNLKFGIRDLGIYEDYIHYGFLRPRWEVWWEKKGEGDVNTYQPPFLFHDKHQNVIYQIPGYYSGNSPIFINLSKWFCSKHVYGGIVFSQEENVERLRHFTRWRFCAKEIGTLFPIQLAAKPLVKVTDYESSRPPSSFEAFRIPLKTVDELYHEKTLMKTKCLNISCNLIDIRDGNTQRILESIIISPDINNENYGIFERYNCTFAQPKFHKVNLTSIKEIEIEIKENSTGKLLKIPTGETVLTLQIIT